MRTRIPSERLNEAVESYAVPVTNPSWLKATSPARYPGWVMLHIRSATPADVPTMLRFIHELAAYEREADKVVATETDLLRDGFGLDASGRATESAAPVRFQALIAEWDGMPAGFALYFSSYSTWVGHHGIRLEDLYVTPSLRGQGIGRALLTALARIAINEGCSRLEWDVLTWNEPAIAVYRRLGATTQEEWRIMRLSGEALQSLAGRGEPSERQAARPST